jgi:hypothetical protein
MLVHGSELLNLILSFLQKKVFKEKDPPIDSDQVVIRRHSGKQAGIDYLFPEKYILVLRYQSPICFLIPRYPPNHQNSHPGQNPGGEGLSRQRYQSVGGLYARRP